MQGNKFVSHSNYHTDGVILVLSGSLLHQIQLVTNWDDLVVSGSKWEKETKHLGVRRGISHPMANSQAHNAVKDKQTNRQTVRNQKCCQISGRKDMRLKCVFTNVVLSLWKTKSKKTKLTILETSFLLHEGQFCSRRCDQKQLSAKIFAEIIDRN